jgi:diguanylate cyclase (GGDEF)-like protein
MAVLEKGPWAMTYDIRPFWFIGALCGNGFGLLVLMVRKGYPDYLRHTLEYLGLANLCLGMSYFARSSGGWIGPFSFDVLSSTMIAICMSLEYLAICELKRRTALAICTLGAPLSMFTACTWFGFVQRNISVQLVLVDGIRITMLFVLAATLLRRESGKRLFVDALTAAAYSFLGICTCVVLVDSLRTGRFPVEVDFNQPRSVFGDVATIITQGAVFPLFLLMVSERLNRDLIVQAMRDPLTGLYNRRAFEELAFRELSGAARTGLGVSLVIFDVDRLKNINDKLGHSAGDEALVAVSGALRSSLRDEDYLCRWGGDEFCALLPRARREQAHAILVRVHKSCAELDFSFEGEPIEITLSMGLATDDGRTRDLAKLLKLADAALYQAKQAGRNQFVIVSNEKLA